VATGGPVELLAPARDPACGRAAIDCGADAVYIGPARFGAREKAANELADIEELVRYAHRYRARVYATLNTLLHDRELPVAQALIHRLWDAGIDALIIQDLGLLELDLPPVPLFASTQLDCVEPAKARFLEALGFQRIILARELSLDEIEAVRAATALPLEVFVHGALCVSYSGRCSASWALGGRSANRGRCAQPCRLPWTLSDGAGRVLAEGRHLLSLEDMDRSAWLGALVDAGVGSLKIEGRLKDERYVRNVVGHYRRSLDAVLAARDRPRASSGRVQLGFEPDPRRSFHRGATPYFLNGRERGISTPHSPKSTGQPIGRVVRIRDGWVELDLVHDLGAGDGLVFVGADGAFRGTAVERVRGAQVAVADIAGLEAGVAVSRNRDRAFERQLDRAPTRRSIALDLSLRLRDEGPVLEASDEDGVTVALPLSGEAPRDPGSAAEVARSQLSKLRGTEFELRAWSAASGAVPHLRRAAWNELRRALVQRLRAARLEAHPRLVAPDRPARADAPWERLDFRANVINEAARALLERCGVGRIEPGAEAGTPLSGRPVMTSRYCLRFELGLCPRHQDGPQPAEPWSIEDPQGRRLALRFDCARCEMQVLGP
jgi:collagenase-like PrtC family protease